MLIRGLARTAPYGSIYPLIGFLNIIQWLFSRPVSNDVDMCSWKDELQKNEEQIIHNHTYTEKFSSPNAASIVSF
jgi:hypothetical protein